MTDTDERTAPPTRRQRQAAKIAEALSKLRTSAESSTTITRIFLLINSNLYQNRSTEPPDVVLATVAALPRTS